MHCYDDSILYAGRPHKTRNPDLIDHESDPVYDESITTRKLADGAVTTDKLADESVTLQKLDQTVLSEFATKTDLANLAPMIVACDDAAFALLGSLGYYPVTQLTPEDFYSWMPNSAERMLISWTYGTKLEIAHVCLQYDGDTDQVTAFSDGQDSSLSGIVGVDTEWTVTEGRNITTITNDEIDDITLA